MSVKITGVKQAVKALKEYPDAVNSVLRKSLMSYGEKMVSSARGNHKYNTQSGNLDKSIQYEVSKPREWPLKFIFQIKADLVTSGNYNYGIIQHEGSGVNYRRSKMAKRYSVKLKKGGVKADHFMVRAWDKYANKLTDSIKRGLVTAAKKQGLM